MKPDDVTRPASNPFRTICEVHRQIYKAVMEDKDKQEITELIQEAYVMAKKMDAKLRQYKFNYDEDWWEINKVSRETIHRSV